MDDINVEWPSKKSPIKHMFKGFGPIDCCSHNLLFWIPYLEPNSLKK
jgi:hypothetical protein